MKTFFLIFALMTTLAACSSNKKVEQMSQSFEPILGKEAQIERIVKMISNDPKLNQEEKDQLITLLNQQVKISEEMKKEQSQLRALLIDQLLKSSNGSNSQTIATTRKLQKLYKKNIKELNHFVLKFKSITGQRDINHQDYMSEMAGLHPSLR